MSRFTKITATAVALLALSGCKVMSEPVTINVPDLPINIEVVVDAPVEQSQPVQIEQPTAQDAAQALATLETLPIDLTPYLGEYDREGQFGEDWSFDFDRNGCDTRNDILARDMTNTVGSSTDDCTVFSGTLNDPYTGQQINFIRGQGTSNAVNIDHIVPLSYAITVGADQWSYGDRVAFANDPINLLAVDGPTNRNDKGSKSPAEWMVPANPDFACTYAIKWVEVLDTYNLEVKIADQAALASTLTQCK